MPSRLADLAALLRCPRCDAASWATSDSEIESRLACTACGAEYVSARGVLDLGDVNEDPQVALERAAVHHTEQRPELGGINDTFQDLARAQGELRDAILALPYGNNSRYYRESGYFSNVRGAVAGFDFVVNHLDLQPGNRLLDLGADTTWSTSQFARRGLDCTAVDINDHLAVGELFGRHHGAPYHMVRADMRRVPFRSSTFDIVVALHALHHNPELAAVAGNIARMLKPGGQLAFVEPYCRDEASKDAFGRDQIAVGISEQTYLLGEWHDAFVAVGLEIEWLSVCESFCAVYRKRTETDRPLSGGIEGLFRGAYSGRLAIKGSEGATVAAGSGWTLPIVITNTSRATWCSASQFPVYASYHLHRRDERGTELVAFDNVRTRLPHALGPGRDLAFALEIAAVDTPGRYVAHIDLVHEGVSWFAAHGFGTIELPFIVR